MTDPIVCQLCGHSDKRDLGTSLAHWRDAPAGVWPLVTEVSDHRRAS